MFTDRQPTNLMEGNLHAYAAHIEADVTKREIKTMLLTTAQFSLLRPAVRSRIGTQPSYEFTEKQHHIEQPSAKI